MTTQVDTLAVPAPYPAVASGEALPAGANGPSNYELAVMTGYTGTLQQWLAAQVGPQGAPGNKGADGLVQSVGGVSKAAIGLVDLNLDQVNNTSDVNKPVSTLQQAALDGKFSVTKAHAVTNPDNAPNGVSSGDVSTITGQLYGWHFITDIRSNGKYGVQFALSDTFAGLIYVRSLINSVWSAWSRIAVTASPFLSNATLTGLTTHGDKTTVPSSSMSLSLASQPQPVYGSDLMQGGSKLSGGMEFFRATDINVTHGASDRTADANAYKAAKVGEYVCLTATATAGDCYAFNGLVNCQAGHPGAAITFESDLNDYNVPGTAGHVVPAYTLSDIASGALVSPIRCHFYAAGLTQGPMSAVFLANFSYGYMKAKRVFGIYGPGGSVAGPIMESNVGATALWTATGALTKGFDLSGATLSSYAMDLPNGATIGWAGASGGARGVVQYTSGNLLFLNGGLIVVGAPLLPAADNAFSIGNSTNRFTTVYAVNGTASSSDAELKDGIADLPGDETFDLVMALAPKSWRWKVGGQDVSEADEACEVQATDPESGEPIFDLEPVIDPATGKQAVKTIPAREAVPDLYGVDAAGKRVLVREGRPAVPAQEVLLTTQVKRMVPGTRKVPVYTDRPGKRTHAGYIYQEVEAALAAKAVDYGICDRAEGGGVFLRMERFTPLLHRAFQIHTQRTEARLAAIEAKLSIAK